MTCDIIYRGNGSETGSLSHKSCRPSWFDKLKCYKTVLTMVEQMPEVFKLHVLYDGAGSPLLDYINATTPKPQMLMQTKCDIFESIKHQWELADQMRSDWIYFVEDDYLHLPDAARVFVEGMGKFNLFTLYDHLDRYTRTDDVTQGKEWIAVTNSCHWRTAESTCMTWAVSRKLWGQIRSTTRQPECLYDRPLFRALLERNIRLWSPIPGRSTHCIAPYLSPLVDWQKLSEGIKP